MLTIATILVVSYGEGDHWMIPSALFGLMCGLALAGDVTMLVHGVQWLRGR